MATNENVSHSPRPRRIQNITAGLILVCLVPLMGSFARDHCAVGTLSLGCVFWSAGALLSVCFGLGLIFVRSTFRSLRRRIWRSARDEPFIIGGMMIVMIAAGMTGGMLTAWMNEQCWQHIALCLFYGFLSIVCWGAVAACLVLLYFGLLHHPILQTLAESQRHPHLRHHEDE